MAELNYSKAKALLTKGIVDHPIRTGLNNQKTYDLLLLEKSTIRDITKAYEQARTEIGRALKDSYDKYLKNFESMTPAQREIAQIKFLRDAQLYENLETRIGQLGGQVDKINANAILNASGISNEYIQNELNVLTFFENLDPQNFARINMIQAELAINKVNDGTKFINDAIKTDTLTKMRQEMRVGILKGESIPKIAERLVGKAGLTLDAVKPGVFSTVMQRARLNARWGIIESANSANEIQYNAFNVRCAENGIQTRVKKQAISHMDDRTSECCIGVHGQIQEVGQPFDTSEGLIDYPPFHCNCRTSTGAWHELFEAYGKSTDDMIAEAKQEAEKRARAQAVKNKARQPSAKRLAAQQKKQQATAKFINKTIATAPPGTQIPTLDITRSLQPMSTNEANKILQMPTNAARNKAIAQSKAEKGSMEKIAQNHVAKVQKSGKIPKDLAAYDKEVLGKGTMNLGDAADLVRKAELPGNVDIIGGLARRGNTQHDIDLIIRAQNKTLAEVQAKLKPLFEEFRKRGISMDAYIQHSAGVTMGDPNTWIQGTEKYLEMLAKNHQDWAFRIPKYTDDIIAYGKKIKVIPGQQDLFSVTYEQTPKPVTKPPPQQGPPGKLAQVEYNGNKLKFYSDDAADIKALIDSKADGFEIVERIKMAEDRIIKNTSMIKTEIKTGGQYNKQRLYVEMSNTEEAVLKREIIAKRLNSKFDSWELYRDYMKYVEDDLKEVLEWGAGRRRVVMNMDFSGGTEKLTKTLDKWANGSQVNWHPGARAALTGDSKYYVDDQIDIATRWLNRKVAPDVHERAGQSYLNIVKYKADGSSRAYCSGSDIFVNTKSNAATYVHEYGHHLAHNNYKIESIFENLFKERTGMLDPNAKITLNRIYPTLPKNKELAAMYKANGDYLFPTDPYVGKVYGIESSTTAEISLGTRNLRLGVEMPSMGLQHMFENATDLLQKDPELFQAIFGVMMGLL